MTQRELSAQIAGHMITLICAICLALLLAYAAAKDEADNDKARMHAEQQAKAAAQPDTWVGLDRDSKRMVAYDRIKK